MSLVAEIVSRGMLALGTGAQNVTSWANQRIAREMLHEIDERLLKSAVKAKQAGNDGAHDLADMKDVNPPMAGDGSGERKALHFDPFDLVAAMGYRERPTQISYMSLERIGRGVPIFADIIQTRKNQVIMFCDRPDGRHSTGFKVQPKNDDLTFSPKMQKKAYQIEEFLLNCGTKKKPGKSDNEHRGGLLEFAKKAIDDSLIYDQMCFEKVRDRKGRISYFDNVDPATIRRLDPGWREPGDAFAVQVIGGSIVGDFTSEELAFCVRNPRSGIRSYGYGLSEIETLIREVTALLWGIEYNAKFFTQGSATRGVLNFKGSIPDRHLAAFRRQWYAMVSGVANAWRTPITNAEDLQWINMQMSNRDMEYSAWIDFLIKIACARFNISTDEVQFSYGNTGQSQSMGQSPVEEKIKASKDLGLRPLVKWFFQQLNEHIVNEIDPDFEAVPVGLDSKGEEAEIELFKNKASVYLTIDEVRQAAGEEPLGEEAGGNVIENAVWLQWKLAQDAAKQQADMQQQQGMGPDGAPMDDGQGGGAPDGGDDDFGFDDEIDSSDGDSGGSDQGAVEKSSDREARATYSLDL